jgi:predicted transposase/invertase (TIGR01784 family)
MINTRDRESIKMVAPADIFPEYYIIRVNEFNKIATTPLEEWIAYLKDGNIKDDTKAPGLAEAKEKLRYLQMTDQERAAYDRHLDNIMVQNDILETKIIEGFEKGIEKGMAQGKAEGIAAVARNLIASGMPVADVAKFTGLSEEQLQSLVSD